MAASTLINLGEFIDALAVLRRGKVLVVMDTEAWVCMLDGSPLLWSFRVLRDHGLIAEFDNPAGFEGLRYYRMTDDGLSFSERALAAWQARAWHERLAIRLFG